MCKPSMFIVHLLCLKFTVHTVYSVHNCVWSVIIPEYWCVKVTLKLGERESEPRTSVFNVKFCLYGMYIRWTVRPGHLSWSLVLRTVTATTFTYVVLSDLSPKYCKYVQLWVMSTDAEGKEDCKSSWDKRATVHVLRRLCSLLPHSHLPHNALCSPMYCT